MNFSFVRYCPLSSNDRVELGSYTLTVGIFWYIRGGDARNGTGSFAAGVAATAAAAAGGRTADSPVCGGTAPFIGTNAWLVTTKAAVIDPQ